MDKENIKLASFYEGVYGQRYFNAVDGKLVDNGYALDTSLFWPDGRLKSWSLLFYELKYGKVFRQAEEISGLNPTALYPETRDKLVKFFAPFLANGQLDRFLAETCRFEIVTYEGKLESHRDVTLQEIGIDTIHPIDDLEATAATVPAVWPLSKQSGVLIFLNVNNISKLEEEMFDEFKHRTGQRNGVDYNAWRRFEIQPLALQSVIGHELTHHLLSIVGMSHECQSSLEFEAGIDEFVTRIMAEFKISELTPHRVRNFLEGKNRVES